MTRDEAIKKVRDYMVKHGASSDAAFYALVDPSPMYGCLLMLEALGLVEFEEPPRSER